MPASINGGHLLTPYLVQSVTDDNGNTVYYHETEENRQVISESTSSILRGMLESVVANGSGHNAYMAGYRIAGKTGTSEKRDETTGDVICSFMGFAPVDNPKVLVLLAYDSPERANGTSNYTPSGTYISGGNITAPMAGELIANILDYMGVEKRSTPARSWPAVIPPCPGSPATSSPWPRARPGPGAETCAPSARAASSPPRCPRRG